MTTSLPRPAQHQTPLPTHLGHVSSVLSDAVIDDRENGVIRARVAEGKENEGAKYRDYFDHSEALARIPSHRLLALFRAHITTNLHVVLTMTPPRGDMAQRAAASPALLNRCTLVYCWT